MRSFEKICVYCGSRFGEKETYKQVATEMGKLCAAQGWVLVYGGGRIGLMGTVADAALKNGGEVIGIIPEDLHSREVAHLGVTQLHLTKSMHERQMMMARTADAFVALPGGLGTLAEFFEILTWRQLRFHLKPIILVNIEGFWDPLLEMIGYVSKEGFIHSDDGQLYAVTDKISEIPDILKRFAPAEGPVRTEKM